MATTRSEQPPSPNATTTSNRHRPDAADPTTNVAILNSALAQSPDYAVWEWHAISGSYREIGLWQDGLGYGDEEAFLTFDALVCRVHPEDQDDFSNFIKTAAARPSRDTFIAARHRASNGSFHRLETRISTIEHDSSGNPLVILGTHTDVSDLKAVNRHLELALKIGRQGLWEWRPSEDLIEFSGSWQALYGYDEDEITNTRTHLRAIIHPEDFQRTRTSLVALLKGTQSEHAIDYRIRCKDGNYIWIMEHCSVVERDASGNASLVIGTHVDISAHKSVQIELMESRRLLNLVLNTIPDMVYWKDAESRYLGANLAYARVAGLKEPNDIIGLTDYELPWAEYTPKFQLADRRAITSRKPIFSINQAFVDASGMQHLVETSKVPIVDEAGAALGVLGISQEVSKQRQYEKQLEKLAQCITGNDTDRLLDALTQAAVELSNAAIAFVATLGKDGKTATVVSTYPANAEINGLSYLVNGTPCENLLENEFCVQAVDVQAAYPKDQSLVEMGVASYAGKRLLNHQQSPIGIFALLDTKPIDDPSYAMSVLNIVSATASAELQREDREIELRESELRYRTTYDNVPVIICTVDDSHTITDLNNAWVATTGFTVDESVGSKLYSYLTEASRTRFLDVASSRANGSNPSDVVLDFVCKSGDQLKLAYSATRTSAADGAPVYITVLEDITSHQIAEQQLRLAATAFETHEALVIRDAERRILRVNEAFKRITGYSDLDVLGETSTILVAGPSADVDEREIWTVVDETSEWDGERISYRADGSTFAAWYTISAVRADDGTITHYVENFADISELKQAHAEAERLALYDPLTELPNRRYLIEKLGSEIARARRHSSTGALLFIDLDQFKTINDSLGHTVGDELLIQVARRLKRLLRQEDSIARLGGDEFVVVLPELGDETEQCINQARRVADKIHFELGKNYELGNHQVHVTPTIGVTLFPEGGKTVEEILQEADSAMYRGKADGRNVTKFFHPSMQSEAQQRLSLERDLRTAAERDELALYFQPQYDADYKMFAAEALLRWNHPERGFVSPAHFIPIAEESGLILEISRWVFTRALECLRRWDRDGFVHVDHLAINVSSRQFSSSTFVQDVMRDLVAMSVPANRVVLEVTEGTVIKNFDATARKMEQLRDIGIRFSVDDFGIGYSSLSYLSRLPLDQLKIDQSFVIDVLEDPNDKVIAETIIGMGRNLNLQTIAEGVETTAQLEFLRSLGCDGFQGFLLSKPVPESDFLLLDKTWTGPANKRSH